MSIIIKLEQLYASYINRKWKYYKKMEEKYHDKNDWFWQVVKAPKTFDVPLLKRLYMYKKGFSSDEYIKYSFEQNNMNDYLNEVERWQSRRINGIYNIILDDKEVFYHTFKDYIHTPKIIGIVKNGKICTEENRSLNFEKTLELIRKSNGIVFRVNRGGGGLGLSIIKYHDNIYEENGHIIEPKKIKNFIKEREGYILTECLENAEYSAKIFNKSVNTIRIVIGKEKNSTEYNVLATYHRFGCNKSIPGDNVCRGGLIAPIDMKTGVIGKATTKYYNGFYKKHPDTNSTIEGVVVPNFKKIKKQLIDLAYKFSYFNMIAWDVVVTKDGFSIIEGNASTDINMFQYFGGIKNTKLGKFYQSYGIGVKKK